MTHRRPEHDGKAAAIPGSTVAAEAPQPEGRRRVRVVLAALLGGFLALGAGLAQEYVPQENEGLPRIRFADGLLSLNDHCPVRGGKLNLRIDPLFVNGQPVGFC